MGLLPKGMLKFRDQDGEVFVRPVHRRHRDGSMTVTAPDKFKAPLLLVCPEWILEFTPERRVRPMGKKVNESLYRFLGMGEMFRFLKEPNPTRGVFVKHQGDSYRPLYSLSGPLRKASPTALVSALGYQEARYAFVVTHIFSSPAGVVVQVVAPCTHEEAVHAAIEYATRTLHCEPLQEGTKRQLIDGGGVVRIREYVLSVVAFFKPQVVIPQEAASDD